MSGVAVRVSGVNARGLDEEELARVQGQAEAPAPATAAPPPDPALASASLPEVPDFTGKDWGADLEAARAKGDELRALAAIARTGDEINAAFMRRKPSGIAGGELEELAKLPEARVGENMRLEKVALERARAQEESDPASASNQRFRLMLRSQFPDLAQGLGGNFERLTRSQAEQLLGMRAGAQAERLKQDKFTLEGQEQAERARHNKATEAIGWANANRESRSMQIQDEIRRRHAINNMGQLRKDLSKYAGAIETWANIERLAPGLTFGTVPKDFVLDDWERVKTDILPRLGGRRFNEQQTNSLRAALDRVRLDMQKELFGSALSEHEKAAFDRMFSDAFMSGPPAMAAALQVFRQHLGARVNSDIAFYRQHFPEETEGYLEMSGMNRVLPLFGDTFKPLPADSPASTMGNQAAGIAPPSAAPTPAPSATPAPAPQPASGPEANKVQGGNSDVVTVKVKGTDKVKTMSRADAEKFRNDPRFEVSP